VKKTLLFLLIFLPILYFLTFSLSRSPRDLPSALIGKEAPLFELTTLDGSSYSLEKARGRPVIVNFWATWCDPCIYEHEVLRAASTQYKDMEIDIVAILYEDTPEKAQAFIRKHGRAAPILLDTDLQTAIDYGVSGIPETFFINTEGVVSYKHTGVLTPEIMDEQIALLIKK
jgi:cytochrome c biogenesis protein CcmG, thiol:disulfide interchange protein DsbE